jgi:hypothetical protein
MNSVESAVACHHPSTLPQSTRLGGYVVLSTAPYPRNLAACDLDEKTPQCDPGRAGVQWRSTTPLPPHKKR